MARKKRLYFYLILAFIVVWSFLLYFIGPDKIVGKIGIQDSYIVLFFVGALGGVSLISATSYYASLIALTSAGLNPILLGIIGGVGITLGDSFYYYFGLKGKENLSGKFKLKIEKFASWLAQKKTLVPIVSFIYFAFTPFPNEFLTIPLGLSGYSYKKLLIPLLIGNLILSIFTAKFLYTFIKLI